MTNSGGTGSHDLDYVDADYQEAQLPEHRGNPLIEALPAFQIAREMFHEFHIWPTFTETERALSAAERMLAIGRLGRFLQALPCHFDVIDQLGMMIRTGYAFRRPDQSAYRKAVTQFYHRAMAGEICAIETPGPATAPSFSLFGVSGVGKTSVVERALFFLPQVIRHAQYGFMQVVHMKVDCPPDGRLKQLLLAILDQFDRLLGTNYRGEAGQRKAADELILFVAVKAAEHHLGVLVIDEIQHLLTAPGETKDWMLNFFVTFANEVKVPIVFVGTPRAQQILRGTFRQARRVGDHGAVVWDRFSEDEEWGLFLTSMWRFQWVRHPVSLTDDMSSCLYDLSQGIHAVVVRLFQLAQIAAIQDGSETLSISLFEQVAKSKFKLIAPMLSALRDNNEKQIIQFEDLFTDGLGDLGMAVQRDADLHRMKRATKDAHKSDEAKTQTVSTLLVLGHEEPVARRLVDELFAAIPDLAPQEAIRRLLNAAETGHAEGSGLPGPSLREIIERAAANGVSPVDALADAGLAEPITQRG